MEEADGARNAAKCAASIHQTLNTSTSNTLYLKDLEFNKVRG